MATQASFGDMPVRDFVAALSAKQPTPGGGAAAALAAALGDASGAMACVYTQRKKDRERGVFDKAKASGDLLTASALSDVAAADADAAAYAALQSTWKKDCALTEAEKDRVAADALAVPVDLLERCYLNARDVAAFVPLCNPNIVSDAKVALHLLAGAARAAHATVLVNSPPEDVKRDCEAKLAELADAEAAVLGLGGGPRAARGAVGAAAAVALGVAFALGRASKR